MSTQEAVAQRITQLSTDYIMRTKKTLSSENIVRLRNISHLQYRGT